jgi:hypothetical protein
MTLARRTAGLAVGALSFPNGSCSASLDKTGATPGSDCDGAVTFDEDVLLVGSSTLVEGPSILM